MEQKKGSGKLLDPADQPVSSICLHAPAPVSPHTTVPRRPLFTAAHPSSLPAAASSPHSQVADGFCLPTIPAPRVTLHPQECCPHALCLGCGTRCPGSSPP